MNIQVFSAMTNRDVHHTQGGLNIYHFIIPCRKIKYLIFFLIHKLANKRS